MKKIVTAISLLCTFLAFAQSEKKDVALSDGNAAFKESKFSDAEANYRISASRAPKKADASYNLGNAIYTMKQPSEAKNAYLNAVENAKTRVQKHKAFHNLGNAFMQEKNYQGAVEAYKQALINNPADDETRYNFALAKKFLKENPPKKDDKKDDKKKDDKDKQDKKKDDKNKDPKNEKDNEKDKNDKDKDSQNNKNNDKKDDSKGDKPKPEPRDGISKQRVENLLDAVNNEERKVQEKVNKKKVKGKPVNTEKDW